MKFLRKIVGLVRIRALLSSLNPVTFTNSTTFHRSQHRKVILNYLFSCSIPLVTQLRRSTITIMRSVCESFTLFIGSLPKSPVTPPEPSFEVNMTEGVLR